MTRLGGVAHAIIGMLLAKKGTGCGCFMRMVDTCPQAGSVRAVSDERDP